MARNKGWWELNLTNNNPDELSDADLEHIAYCIKKGVTSGEIVEDED